MCREHLAAFVFPSTDPHHSGYVADHWKGLEWLSGFNASTGIAVVTQTGAALWTDSRYFQVAEERLKDTEFQLMKIDSAPTIAHWIGAQLSAHSVSGSFTPSTEVGIDGWCSSVSDVKALIADLRKEGGLTLRTNLDPLRELWRDRPPLPKAPLTIQPPADASDSAHDKLVRIRKALRERHADGMLMADLGDIAWALNLRGSDVPDALVFVSYLLISTTSAILYVDKAKVTSEVAAYLKNEGVTVDAYEHVTQGLKDYFEYSILLDPDEVNYALYQVLCRGRASTSPWKKQPSVIRIIEDESPLRRFPR